MFNVMETRWLYCSEKLLVAEEPVSCRKIMWIRNGGDRGNIDRVLRQLKLKEDGKPFEREGKRYVYLMEDRCLEELQ